MPARQLGPPYRSILCPVDFSIHSQHALQYAARLARQMHGRVTVLFVNDPLLLMAAQEAYGSQREFIRQGRAELSRFVRRSLGARAALVTMTVAVGEPAREILRAATRLRADLLVVGTHGLSGVSLLSFGSTTAEVLRLASLPVFAVPAAATPPRPPAGRPIVDRVIAPIDLTGTWLPDAVHAAAIAKAFGVRLHLLHVVRPSRLPSWMRPARAATADRLASATRRLERVTRLLDHTVTSASSVTVGEPAHEIARATRSGSPLVVMALRGTRAIRGRRGAIAYHVLTQARTPVLALPRRQPGGPLLTRIRRELSSAR